MAISWGSWDYGNSSAGFRVGVETTVSSVTHSSSSVTITTKWYVEAMYNVNDEMTLTYGGSISGSTTTNLTTGGSGGYKLFATKTYTYNYTTYGSSPGTRTFSGSLSGVYNGANPSKSVTVTIPARPYGVPAAPTSVSEVRNSDSQATVSWTRNATTGEPYTSLLIRMRTMTPNGIWGSWADVATVSGTATSYVKTGLIANRVYQFAVRANNSVGSSAFAYDSTPYVRMTPAAPSGVASVLNSTGTSITTTWTNNHYPDGTNITLTVQRSVNGGAFANVATGLGSLTTSWTDPTPGAGTNRYQVAAVQSVGSLTSAYAQGNTVTTIVAPLAPTQLSPNGTGADFSKNVTFTWKHNPGGDGAAQSHYTLQTYDGATWTTRANDIASTASAYTLPAGTIANGTTIQWRVKTEGIVSAGYGPYSANGTVTGSTTPTATITSPGATLNTLPLSLDWDYNQDELSPQTAWEVVLLNAAGTSTLETKSGFDDSASVAFSYPLVDGTTYLVRVRVRSGAGIWSDWAEQSFAFSLLPPAAGLLTAEFQPETGTTLLSITAEAPVPGVTVAADTVVVDRRINGGEWLTLATNLPVPIDFLDVLPITNGLNEYRVTTVSLSPSYSMSDPVSVIPPNPLTDPAGPALQWVLLNFGDDFSTLLRFRGDPEIDEVGGLDKALHEFSGRSRPLPAFGDNAFREVSVKGSLVYDVTGASPDAALWDSPPQDWTLAGRAAEVVCYRDFTGRRVFGTLSDVSATDVSPGLGTVAFVVTETDYLEPEGWVDRDAVRTGDYVIDGGDAYGTGATEFDGGTA